MSCRGDRFNAQENESDMMERYRCSKCSREFFVKDTCTCCAPAPGPHFCPDCGGELFPLHAARTAYFCSPDNFEVD